jgi:hypothetical protein
MSDSSPKANPENPHLRQAQPVPDVELSRQRRDAGYLKSLQEDFALGRSGVQKRQEASATPRTFGSTDLPPEFRDTAAEFVLGRMQDIVLSESPVDQPSLFPKQRPVPDVDLVGTDRRIPAEAPELTGSVTAPGHGQGVNLGAEGVPPAQRVAAEVGDTTRHSSHNLIFVAASKNVVEKARQAPIRLRSLAYRLWSHACSQLRLPAVKQVLGNATKSRADAIRSVLTRRMTVRLPAWRNPLPSWHSAWMRWLRRRPVVSKLPDSHIRGAARAQTFERPTAARKASHALPASRASQWAFGGTPWVVACSVVIAVLISAQVYYLWWPMFHTRRQAEQAITPPLRISNAISHQTAGNELTLKPVSAERRNQLTQGPPPSAAEVPSALALSTHASAHLARPKSRLGNKHAAISRRSRHGKPRHKTHKQNGAH